MALFLTHIATLLRGNLRGQKKFSVNEIGTILQSLKNITDSDNLHACWLANQLGTVYKGRPPEGGEGGFQDSGWKWTWGEGGFWENGCPLFRTFQNIIVTKIYLISFEIKVELLPFMGGQSSVNGEKTNVFKFSSSTKRIWNDVPYEKTSKKVLLVKGGVRQVGCPFLGG